ncbi:MAG: hypothetical protein ABI566_10415 [Pseudolysinimonas sp.]
MTSRPVTPIALGFAALGMISLAGCAPGSAIADPTSGSGSTTSSTPSAPARTSAFLDGTYTADGSYQAPSGIESITVELTVVDDVVTAVSTSGHATDHEAQEFQTLFSSAISSEAVGADLATLSVTRVAGSSLTSNGFNSALDDIRSQAA